MRSAHSTTAITSDLYTHVDRGLGRGAATQIADVLGTDVSEVLARAGRLSEPGQVEAGALLTHEAPEDSVYAGQGDSP